MPNSDEPVQSHSYLAKAIAFYTISISEFIVLLTVAAETAVLNKREFINLLAPATDEQALKDIFPKATGSSSYLFLFI